VAVPGLRDKDLIQLLRVLPCPASEVLRRCHADRPKRDIGGWIDKSGRALAEWRRRGQFAG
jgi:hypothetical protein